MAGSFTSTGSYSNLTRLELEQLRRSDFYVGRKALTVGDSALTPEGVVGRGDVNAEPYSTGTTVAGKDVMSITPPPNPGSVLGTVTNLSQLSGGFTAGNPQSLPTGTLTSTSGTWYGPQEVQGSPTGNTNTVVVATTTMTGPGQTVVTTSVSLISVLFPGQWVLINGFWLQVASVTSSSFTLSGVYEGAAGGTNISMAYWTDTNNSVSYVLYLANLTVNNSSFTVNTASSYVGIIHANDTIAFGSQPGVYYKVNSVSSSTIVLALNYTGPSTTTYGLGYLNTSPGGTDTSVRTGDILLVIDPAHVGVNPNLVGTVASFFASNQLTLNNINAGFVPTGTFGVANGSPLVSTTKSQVGIIAAGDVVEFASQPGVAYRVNSLTSSQLNLGSTNYSGTSAGATTAVGVMQNNSATATPYGIIRPAAVQLFAVPGSGPTGEEQTFLMVNPNPSSALLTSLGLGTTLHNTIAPTVDQINGLRVTNVIPPAYGANTLVDRADGIYDAPSGPRTSGDKLGYRVILYPDDGSGQNPDMTSPIATLSPIIDPGIPATDQRLTIDYKAGVVRFSCAPQIGGQVKVAGGVNNFTGRLNLYAVFFAYPEPGSALSTIPTPDSGVSSSAATALAFYKAGSGYTFTTAAELSSDLTFVSQLVSTVTAANWDAVIPVSGGFSGLGSATQIRGAVYNPFLGAYVLLIGTATPSFTGYATYDHGRTMTALTFSSPSMGFGWGVGVNPNNGAMVAAYNGSSGTGFVNSTNNAFQTAAWTSSAMALQSAITWFPFTSAAAWVAITGASSAGTFTGAYSLNTNALGEGVWTNETSLLPANWQSDSSNDGNVAALYYAQSTAATDSKGPRLLVGRGTTGGSLQSSHLLLFNASSTTPVDVTPSFFTDANLQGVVYDSLNNVWLASVNTGLGGGSAQLYYSPDPSNTGSWVNTGGFPSFGFGSLAAINGVWVIDVTVDFAAQSVTRYTRDGVSWSIAAFDMAGDLTPRYINTSGGDFFIWEQTLCAFSKKSGFNG